jgi:hypothetical protein
MPIDKVRFRQSGGFAGLVRGVEVSAAELSAADRRALETMASGRRGAPPAGAAGARDLLTYELELDTDSGRVRLEFDESSVPDELSSLVESLAKRARPMPP